MTITIDGNGTITGASTLATTVASPTLTTPNINSAQFATVSGTAPSTLAAHGSTSTALALWLFVPLGTYPALRITGLAITR